MARSGGRNAAAGLTDEQLDQLRAEVAAGKHPRVRIAAAQFGGSANGTVRALGDPASDGDDYVTVRVTVNGVTDDLRFDPRELSRGKSSPSATQPARDAAAPASRARRSRKPTAPAPQPAAPAEATEPAASAKARPSSRRATSAAAVRIELASAGTSWTVSARRGARSVVRNAPVRPGVVSAIVALLDHPGLDEAVAAVNDTARVEAEERAERLRAELAQLEAVLDSHRRP